MDAVLAILTPQAMTDPTATAELVAESAAQDSQAGAGRLDGRPVASRPGDEILAQAGVATYDSPDRAVRALLPRRLPAEPRDPLRDTAAVPLDKWLDVQTGPRTDSELLLPRTGNADGGGIQRRCSRRSASDSTVPLPARTSLEAIRIAGRDRLSGRDENPFARRSLHKTEVRGVVTDVSSDEEVRRVFQEMVARARQLRPDADVQGVTVQPMISSAEGIELIVGAKTDPVFGAVMMVGAGGITAEVYQRSGPGAAAARTSVWPAGCSNRCGSGRCWRVFAAEARSTSSGWSKS